MNKKTHRLVTQSNIANFLTTLNSNFEIDGKCKTLLEHFKLNNLGMDDRTIENMITPDKSGKCCSRLVCEVLITWMYKHKGWPYDKVEIKSVPCKKIKVSKKCISKNLGGLKKMMHYFEENGDGTYSLKDNNISHFSEKWITRFICEAKHQI